MQHQLEAESEPTIYQAGQTWFEPPDAHHIVFMNPSESETARVLAVLFGDKDAELVTPDE
jgi:quercetin dioxygenase-like cupin family protein